MTFPYFYDEVDPDYMAMLIGGYGEYDPYPPEVREQRDVWNVILYLGDAAVCTFWSQAYMRPHAGRRLRVMAQLIKGSLITDEKHALKGFGIREPLLGEMRRPLTYSELWKVLLHSRRDGFEEARYDYARLEISRNTKRDKALITEIDPEYDFTKRASSNPEVHEALQDLGHAWAWDMHLACAAFDDPDIWYPGVDGGIEPLSNERVELTMWAAERELARETRQGRPYAKLRELPFRIQRALAERRRLRFKQYGITPESFESGKWSLFDVDEGREWSPPWDI